MLTILIDPERLPDCAGSNVAVKVALCEGFKLMGKFTPLMARPAPLADMLEISTAALPEFVKTICFLLEVPVPTVPKLRLLGLALNCPIAFELPAPVKGTVIVGFAASLLVMTRLPVVWPVPVGVKVMASVTD